VRYRRRELLLAYFGEHHDGGCGNCDVCLDPPELYDGTIDAQKALSAVYRVGQRFGIGHVVDVLRGSASERIADLRHDELSVYGVGADHSKDEWTSIIRQLVHLGFLRQDIADYSTLKLTSAATPVLKGNVAVTLAKPKARIKHTPEPTKKRSKRQLAGVEIDDALFERLRELRRTIAAEKGVPAYTVFGDASLIDMTVRHPRTPEEFLEVHGVGMTKLKRYGEAFLAELSAGE